MTQSLIAQTIAAQPDDIRSLNDAFCATARPHALLITNHGYAGPTFPAGAPDSGGQITYVNQLARLLASQGFRVTIATRAFTPDETFASFGNRQGAAFMSDEPLVRYIFAPGILDIFVTKEQIYSELPAIAHNLADFIDEEAGAAGINSWDYIAWIDSHYVDAGIIGQFLVKRWMDEAGSTDHRLNKHAWTPHSLAHLKEHNMLAMDEDLKHSELFKARYAAMNFPLRDHLERALIGSLPHRISWMEGYPPAAAIVSTSAAITETVATLGMDPATPLLLFPPGTEIQRYRPHKSVNEDIIQKLFDYLKKVVPADLLSKMKSDPQSFNIIVEAGRMDATKRKSIPVTAMSHLSDNTLLFITGKKGISGIYERLEKLIAEFNLEKRVFLLGMVPDELMAPLMSLPHGEHEDQFRLAIGVSASRMEGWGMAAMDMTAGGMPLVSSPLVPYAMHLKEQDQGSVTIVPLSPDEPADYARAFQKLIDDPKAARAQADKGRQLAQHFDWASLVKNFTHEIEKLI